MIMLKRPFLCIKLQILPNICIKCLVFVRPFYTSSLLNCACMQHACFMHAACMKMFLHAC